MSSPHCRCNFGGFTLYRCMRLKGGPLLSNKHLCAVDRGSCALPPEKMGFWTPLRSCLMHINSIKPKSCVFDAKTFFVFSSFHGYFYTKCFENMRQSLLSVDFCIGSHNAQILAQFVRLSLIHVRHKSLRSNKYGDWGICMTHVMSTFHFVYGVLKNLGAVKPGALTCSTVTVHLM